MAELKDMKKGLGSGN